MKNTDEQCTSKIYSSFLLTNGKGGEKDSIYISSETLPEKCEKTNVHEERNMGENMMTLDPHVVTENDDK